VIEHQNGDRGLLGFQFDGELLLERLFKGWARTYAKTGTSRVSS
jgi:hypothetical protein